MQIIFSLFVHFFFIIALQPLYLPFFRKLVKDGAHKKGLPVQGSLM